MSENRGGINLPCGTWCISECGASVGFILPQAESLSGECLEALFPSSTCSAPSFVQLDPIPAVLSYILFCHLLVPLLSASS